MENYDKKGFRGRKTVDNPVESVHNMLHIRAFIQKLQKSYTIRLLFLAAQLKRQKEDRQRIFRKGE